jgi:hypothetical protein
MERTPRHSGAALGKKAVVCLLVTASAAILLFALGLALDRVWVTALALPFGVAAAVAVRRRVLPDGPPPVAGELLLGSATATYTMAAVALLWLAVYWLLHALLSLVSLDEDRWAWIVTLFWFGPTMLVAAARGAFELDTELHPGTGLRSRYRDVIRFRGRTLKLRALGSVAALAAFIAVALWRGWDDQTIGIVLLCFFALSSATFAVPAGAQRLGSVRAPDVKRVADSAAAAGWDVLPNPQTGDVGIDPYLAEVDLFARKDGLSVLMKVIQGDVGGGGEGQLDPIGWPVVAGLLTAAKALPRSQLPEGVQTVEPVLVLIDAELQPEPLLFAAQNGVALLSVDAGETSARARGVPRLEDELRTIGDGIRTGAGA